MIKDGGTNPSTTCKIAAQQLAADSDVVGVVGAMRSSCSKASHQYFRDNGKRNKGHDNLSKQSNSIYRDRLCCCFDPYCDLVSWCPLKFNPQQYQIPNIKIQVCKILKKQMVPCKSTAEEVSYKCSIDRLKGQNTLHVSIIHFGSEGVESLPKIFILLRNFSRDWKITSFSGTRAFRPVLIAISFLY